MPGSVIRVLGSIEIERPDGTTMPIRNRSRRRLLAYLACERGQTVPVQRLASICDVSPNGVRTGICRLRHDLEDAQIRTIPPGYRLAPDACDASIAESQLAVIDVRDASAAADAFAAVLSMWHGHAFEEFADEPWAEAEAARLEEVRAHLIERMAELLIRADRPDEAIVALRSHVVDFPLRDNGWRLMMLGLDSAGRQAEALRTYQTYRSFLADTTGLEPSIATCALDRQIAAGSTST